MKPEKNDRCRTRRVRLGNRNGDTPFVRYRDSGTRSGCISFGDYLPDLANRVSEKVFVMVPDVLIDYLRG
jgi:hypothetical protein